MPRKRIKPSNNSSPKLSDLFDEFLSEKEIHGASSATLVNYKRILDFTNSDITIDQINKNFLTSFINFLRESSLSVSSINHYLREIRAFCYWCIAYNLFRGNEMIFMGIPQKILINQIRLHLLVVFTTTGNVIQIRDPPLSCLIVISTIITFNLS